VGSRVCVCASHVRSVRPSGARACDGAVCVCRRQRLRRPGGAGGERAGKGGLKIDSGSPKRRHGAIPGTLPPHPVTLLAKQPRARKGLARGPPAGCEEESMEADRQRGQGPHGIATASPDTHWDLPQFTPANTGPERGRHQHSCLARGCSWQGVGATAFGYRPQS